MKKSNVSIFLSYLLRHHPEEIDLNMDEHGWVNVDELIENINNKSKYHLDLPLLKDIVKNDNKGRYRFNNDNSKIKACQGHSIPWVTPELKIIPPPDCLYHGTTAEAYDKILSSGGLSKMKRHAVHMQSDINKAWMSAERWHKTPIVIEIDSRQMALDGIPFGVADNGVWCAEYIPCKYFKKIINQKIDK